MDTSPPTSPTRQSNSKSSRVAPSVGALHRKSHPSLRNLLLNALNYDTKDVLEVDVPAIATNKAWIIRVACGQIVHALDDASDTLSHQVLQELCAELVVRSSAVIRSKMEKSDQSPQQKAHVDGDPTQDDHRQAKTIEKRLSYSHHALPKQSIKNHVSSPIKSPISIFPEDHDIKSRHTFHHYTTVTQGQDYLAFKRKDANVPFILIFYFSAFFFVITGFYWSKDMIVYQEHPTAAISIVFAVLAALFLFWIGFNHLISLLGQYQLVYFPCYYRFVVNLYKSKYGQYPDNCACLFASLASGFYLINIVIIDLCHTITDIHNNIVCLPTTIPPESIIMTMLMVLMMQIVARGVRRSALVGSWIICLIAINVSIFLSGNSNYVWINVLLLLIICVSYELERQPLCQFINTTKAMEAVKVAAELELQLSVYKTLLAAEALESKRSLVSLDFLIWFSVLYLGNLLCLTKNSFHDMISGPSHWS